MSSAMAPAAAPVQYATISEEPAPKSAATSRPDAEESKASSAHDEAVRAAAAHELGSQVATSMPTVPTTPPPQPPDAGAARLVASIVGAMGDRVLADDEMTMIDVCGVRNLSRSNADEFGSFMHRLCELLSHAGASDRVAFTDDATKHAAYRLSGTAYMINADGFDQWELYLSLTPADRAFNVWEAGAAVRVLRVVRPGVQQVFLSGQ